MRSRVGDGTPPACSTALEGRSSGLWWVWHPVAGLLSPQVTGGGKTDRLDATGPGLLCPDTSSGRVVQCRQVTVVGRDGLGTTVRRSRAPLPSQSGRPSSSS